MLLWRRLAHTKPAHAQLFPSKLLNKKQKTPASLYVADQQAADLINRYLEPYIQRSNCDTALEFNPGIALFTHKLLDRETKFKKLILIEQLEHFMPQLQELHSLYPERVKVKQGDMTNMWKLVYQDNQDNGMRVAELMQDVPKRAYEDEPNMLMFGGVGSYNFFKSLINSLVFQTGLFSWGRTEMYLIVPPPIYIHLTCNNDIGYLIYRATSMLFQIMFEYRFIANVPREHFLPFQSIHSMTKRSKLKRIHSIEPENFYLIHLIPRRNLYELCPAADMPALWYFVKQNCISRRNRIIPNLEKWVPNSGPRLIINTNHKQEHVQPLYPDENIKQLPPYTNRCTTMSPHDHYRDMNIFTEFGDLTPSQMFSLFTQFRQWPEYNESSFLASLENSLLKLEAASDEHIDDIGMTEEEDMSEELDLLSTDELDELTGEKTKAKTTTRKRKVKTTS